MEERKMEERNDSSMAGSETGESETRHEAKRGSKAGRGRPVGSIIRQNIVDLLFVIKHGHGYSIWKSYCKAFPKVTQRSVYYHLQKGIETGEFKVEKIKTEKGVYTWGNEAQRTYYELASKAMPQNEQAVRDALRAELKEMSNRENKKE